MLRLLIITLTILTIFAFLVILIRSNSNSAYEGMEHVNPDEAIDLMNNTSDLKFIDVRTAGEFNAGSIPPAINIDVEQPQRFRKKISELDRDKTYLVFCRAANRSRVAVSKMQEAGFDNVINFNGPIHQMQQVWAMKD